MIKLKGYMKFKEYLKNNQKDIDLSISNLENLNEICICHGHIHILHLIISLIQSNNNLPEIDYLEIGTFKGCSMSLCLQHQCQINAIGIDCFELSGHESSYEFALKNINKYKKEKDSVNLIKGFSTDIETIEKVSDKKYDLILIDGDHSTFAVLNDYKNYFPLLKEGGFMVFDDYITIKDVKIAVDQICSSIDQEKFKIIGCVENLLPNKCSRPNSAFKIRKTHFDNGQMKLNNEFIIQKIINEK